MLEILSVSTVSDNYTAKHVSLVLQPPPEDTSTELDPKYKVTYLSGAEAAAHAHHHQDAQEEAVAAGYAFSRLEASLSGVPIASNNAEAISRLGMTASTSGTTVANEQGKILHECLIWQNESNDVMLRSVFPSQSKATPTLAKTTVVGQRKSNLVAGVNGHTNGILYFRTCNIPDMRLYVQ